MQACIPILIFFLSEALIFFFYWEIFFHLLYCSIYLKLSLRSSHRRLMKINFFLLLWVKMPQQDWQLLKLLINQKCPLSLKYPSSKRFLNQTGHTPKWQEYVPYFWSETESSDSKNHGQLEIKFYFHTLILYQQ